jgi:DnaJ like chaperone protein
MGIDTDLFSCFAEFLYFCHYSFAMKWTTTHFDLRKFARWAGGLLGWGAGGAAGGIAGFIIGAVIDNIRVPPFVDTRRPALGVFSTSLLTLIAVVVQADGKMLRSELDYVKRFLRQNFGLAEQKEALHTLRELLDGHPSLQVACGQVQRFLDRRECTQLVSFLFELAAIDHPASEAERRAVNTIADLLGVHRETAAPSQQKTLIHAAYAELGLLPQATVKEIKQAYRMLVVKYHPDKTAYLGESVKAAASEQFLKINKAYEWIKKERHFS